MGTRLWAAFGNILKLFSLPMFLGSVFMAYNVVRLSQARAPTGLIVVAALITGLTLVMALLFWNAKGPLISGSLVARVLVGLYMLFWVISSLGFALLLIGLAWLVTSDPEYESRDFEPRRPKKPRFTPPKDWHATGSVGPSGATVYSNAEQEAPMGILDSFIPVQVLDRRNGLARVVAATGESGWIDLRSLQESA